MSDPWEDEAADHFGPAPVGRPRLLRLLADNEPDTQTDTQTHTAVDETTHKDGAVRVARH